MQPFLIPPSAMEIRTGDFAGRWYLCDDGWFGTLNLAESGENGLTGTFSSERFDEDYRVTAVAGATRPHAVSFTIHEFNWLPEQHFDGYLLTRGRGRLAGRTTWKDAPFGFFATRATRPSLGTYRPGIARGADFAGEWTAYLDGELATVTLEYDKGSGLLAGSCTGAFGAYDVTGRPGGAVPYELNLNLNAVEGGQAVAELRGYLMSRPKNAISGTMTVGDAEVGFVMIRYA
jgi:hypothetical protein